LNILTFPSFLSSVKIVLRTALLIGIAGIAGFWFLSGANTGWTKTSVATIAVDPITEISYPVWQNQFVPGVDFLAVGVTILLIIFALSYLPFHKSSQKSHQ
jgi:hypothetical protein